MRGALDEGGDAGVGGGVCKCVCVYMLCFRRKGDCDIIVNESTSLFWGPSHPIYL